MKQVFSLIGIFFFLSTLTSGCSQQSEKQEVVIYTSVDQVYSSKILKDFEKKTGITVKAVYDAEASKAVGLEQRLLAEKDNPKADVFWNSEFMRTARLARQGVFAEFHRETGDYLGTNYFSPEKVWYGMGARTRVFIVNMEKLPPEDYPTKLEDLLDPRYKGKIALSTPFSGSTSTHLAALFNKLGKERFIQFLVKLKENNVSFLAGNSVVKDAVGHGKFAFGLVDTDDALVGVEQGLPVKMVYYDQNEQGVFSFFQTVALIKNGPNPSNAAKLIDYLLSERTENELISMNGVQFPLLTELPSEQMPRMWAAQANEIVDSLQPSVTLIREYID
jgi:iron(III) transport system substrate-binding protein